MKKLLILVMSLMLAVPASVCANEPAFSWQEALENAKKNTRRGITLKSYKVQGKIRSEARLEKLIDSWFDNDAYMLLYTPIKDTESNVEVCTILEYKHAHKIPNLPHDESKQYLRKHLNEEMMIVKLRWDINGKEYVTRAVVSEIYEKIYDKFGSFVLIESNSDEQTEVSENKLEHKTTLRLYAVNIFGLKVYDHEFVFRTRFLEDGTIVNSGSSSSVKSGQTGWQVIPSHGGGDSSHKYMTSHHYKIEINGYGGGGHFGLSNNVTHSMR